MSTFCPHQLKETSVIDASITPPTIGTRELKTHSVGICSVKMNCILVTYRSQSTYIIDNFHICILINRIRKNAWKQINRKQTSPRNVVDSITVKNGSIALIV